MHITDIPQGDTVTITNDSRQFFLCGKFFRQENGEYCVEAEIPDHAIFSAKDVSGITNSLYPAISLR